MCKSMIVCLFEHTMNKFEMSESGQDDGKALFRRSHPFASHPNLFTPIPVNPMSRFSDISIQTAMLNNATEETLLPVLYDIVCFSSCLEFSCECFTAAAFRVS